MIDLLSELLSNIWLARVSIVKNISKAMSFISSDSIIRITSYRHPIQKSLSL